MSDTTIMMLAIDDAKILAAFDAVKAFGHDSATAMRYTSRKYHVSADTVEQLVFDRAMRELHRLAVIADAHGYGALLRRQAD